MKIVINGKFGGFGLSEEAMELYRRKTGRDVLKQHVEDYDLIFRSDPVLVAVVDELGSKRASGNHAKLQIVDVDDGRPFLITEYDGREGIEYRDEMDWLVGTEDGPVVISEYLDRIAEGEENENLKPNDCAKCKTGAVIELVLESPDFSDDWFLDYEYRSYWRVHCTANEDHQKLADSSYANAIEWWNNDNPKSE